MQESLFSVISESDELREQFGPRSNKKLLPIHNWVCDAISRRLPDHKICSMGAEWGGKEIKVPGKYYEKYVDVSIHNGAHVSVGAIGIKAISSNYLQNANNYLENMVGEMHNLQSSGKPYGQVIIFRDVFPYYKKDGTLGRKEELKRKHLNKYLRLAQTQVGDLGVLLGLAVVKEELTLHDRRAVRVYSDGEMDRKFGISSSDWGEVSLFSFFDRFAAKVRAGC